MPILSFEKAINVVEENDKIIKLRVLKTGKEAADCYLTFTGTTIYSKEKYPDRAVKSSTEGDFYVKNQNVRWEEGDDKAREIDIRIYSDKEKERSEMFYVTMKSANAEVGIGKSYFHIVEDIKKFVLETALSNNLSLTSKMPPIGGIPGIFKCVSVDTFGLVIPEKANVGPDVKYEENELIWSLVNRQLVQFTGRINISGRYTKEHKDNVQYWYEKTGDEISPYRIITLSLPFTNNSEYPVAVTLSSHYAEGFYRTTKNSVLSTLRGYIAPKTNLLFFEIVSGEYITNLVSIQNDFVLQASINGTVYIDTENILLPTPTKSDYHYWT